MDFNIHWRCGHAGQRAAFEDGKTHWIPSA
jgi:hypothetical protein